MHFQLRTERALDLFELRVEICFEERLLQNELHHPELPKEASGELQFASTDQKSGNGSTEPFRKRRTISVSRTIDDLANRTGILYTPTHMATTVFDTYKAVLLLQKRGLSKEAAEGITELLQDVTESNLVTKDDLELALNRQSVTLIKWAAGTLAAHGVGTAALTVAILQLLQ